MSDNQIVRQDQPVSMPVMSLQGLLYKALGTLSEYEMQMMRQWLEQVNAYAQAMGGWEKNGDQLTLKDDSGIVSKLMDGAQSAAQHAGDALRKQGLGAIISGTIGICSLGCVAAKGLYSYCKTQSPMRTTCKEAEDTQDFIRKNTNTQSESIELKTVTTTQNEEIQAQRQVDTVKRQLMNGDFEPIKLRAKTAPQGGKKLPSSDPGYTPDKEDTDLVRALKRATPEESAQIHKQAADYVKRTQKSLDREKDSFYQFSHNMQGAASVGSNIGQATGSTLQAQEQTLAQSQDAQKTLMQQTTQQMNSKQNDTEQTVARFKQDAESIISSFGTLAQAQVRG